MKEQINTTYEQPSSSHKRLHKTIFPILLSAALLWGCSSPSERIEKREKEVARLEYKLNKQVENYRDISKQQNIQIDLKEEGADATIKQEIGYSTDQIQDYDKEIEKTKKDLAKAQRKLNKAKEDTYITTAPNSNPNCHRSNPKKYDYIPEEYRRSRAQ